MGKADNGEVVDIAYIRSGRRIGESCAFGKARLSCKPELGRDRIAHRQGVKACTAVDATATASTSSGNCQPSAKLDVIGAIASQNICRCDIIANDDPVVARTSVDSHSDAGSVANGERIHTC